MRHIVTSGVLVLFIASAPSASSAVAGGDYTETFDGNVNQGGWTFASTIEAIDAAGGNPGAFLHNSLIDTFAPQPHTTVALSPFTGDFRARDVDGIGVDLKTFSTQFPFARECTLELISGSQTVYFLGTEFVPQVAEGWKSFDFTIDSQSPTLPAGWLSLSAGDPDVVWNTVITNVTEVRFFYGDPTFFFIFDQWDVGLDNARISTGEVGTASCFGVGCPCGNDSPSSGCVNSTGAGGLLAGRGSASVVSDDLVLDATKLPPNNSGLFYMGDTVVNNPFFDGKQCALGVTFRFLNAIQNTGAGGTMSLGPGIAADAGGLILPGTTWHFHAWHRDAAPGPGPCGTGANLTHLYSVTFGV